MIEPKVNFAEPFRREMWAAIAEQVSLDSNSKLGCGTGWSGPKTLFDAGPGRLFAERLRESIPNLEATADISGWANIMDRGDRILAHDHNRSHLGGYNLLAGVYYLEAPEGSSPLVLEGCELEAKTDLLWVWPAHVIHWVPAQEADVRRVSISFNVRDTGQGRN